MQKQDKEYFDGVISTLKQNLGHYDNFKAILEEAESMGFNVDWTISGSPNSWDTDTLLVYILRGYKSDCTNDIIKLLIAHGADVNAVSEDRLHRSALFWSCYWPFYPVEITKLLIDRGADVNSVTDDGQTALEILTCRYLDLAETHGKELLEKINRLGIGPQGFGGKTTALGVNILAMPTHIAGMPCAVNINCHVTRHKSKEI